MLEGFDRPGGAITEGATRRLVGTIDLGSLAAFGAAIVVLALARSRPRRALVAAFVIVPSAVVLREHRAAVVVDEREARWVGGHLSAEPKWPLYWLRSRGVDACSRADKERSTRPVDPAHRLPRDHAEGRQADVQGAGHGAYLRRRSRVRFGPVTATSMTRRNKRSHDAQLGLNRLALAGAAGHVLAFVERVRSSDPESSDDDTILDFEQLVPVPDELRDNHEIDPCDPHGFPKWRTWRVEHWGTKWNAWYAFIDGDPADGQVTYSFQTAWTPPDKWLAKASQNFPELDLHHEYVEEMGHFAGRALWRAGELIEHHELEPDEIEWAQEDDDDKGPGGFVC